MKKKKLFIKNYIKNTHSKKDFQDLESFNENQINEIFNQIINYEK